MTPKELKKQLEELLEELHWTTVRVKTSQQELMRFRDISELSAALQKARAIKFLESQAIDLLKSKIFSEGGKPVSISLEEGQKLISNLNELKGTIASSLNAISILVPKESPDSINIKLPPVENFADLAKVSSEFNTAITQIIFDPNIVDSKNQITSVENGSIWINLLVGATALRVLASVVWSATVIYKKILENKMVEEQVRSYKLRTDSLEDILKAQREQTKTLISAEAAYIQSEHFTGNEPEHIERVKHSISTLSDLIAKGAEIHPALNTPESVKNLFPDFDRILLVQSRIPQIGSGNTSTQNSEAATS